MIISIVPSNTRINRADSGRTKLAVVYLIKKLVKWLLRFNVSGAR